jgi:hypothetical protein
MNKQNKRDENAGATAREKGFFRLPLLAEISIANCNMRIRRHPKIPARVNIINMPQIVMRPKLKVIASEIITVHGANVLAVVRLVPMHGMLMLAEVKLRMVASPVAIC